MTVGYIGTPFHGFALSEGVPTVQGELTAALEKILRHRVSISCAGRTDKGVHALRQVVSFDADSTRRSHRDLARSLNRMLNPQIAVFGAELAAPDFDARLSCTGRSYRYRVLNTPVVDPMSADFVWHVREPLDLAAMRIAADRILGSHDFTTFSRRNRSRPTESLVRQVRDVRWVPTGDIIAFDITANAFTHQMVRSLVSMFVEIGRGRRRAVEMGPALAARDRSVAPSPAPPQGLILRKAHYQSR